MNKGPDTNGISLRMEALWLDAENRIIQDIARRIHKNSKITSTADYQINRLHELGRSTEEIEKILKESLNATYPEMYKLYDDVANWQYVRNKDLYEQVNAEFIPPEENKWLIQVSEAVKKQTKDELENLAKSYGFAIMMGNKRVFTPFAQYYQQYVDNAIMDIISGGYDYNTVIRRVVTQMTNSGLRSVDYASGWSNRTPVAVRRAVMTGVSQITQQVNQRNADILGTDHYEVSWHSSARPEHRVWQGKVYSYKDLVSICGLGSVTGLCGANCYHDYYPFIPGISERLYSDKWLEEQNIKEAYTKTWQGKEYDAYERTQKQRQMETAMRAQREKVDALKAAKVDPDDIMLARAKYQAQLNEYSQFCRKMWLKEQRERIYYDMRGRVAPVRKKKFTSVGVSGKIGEDKYLRKFKKVDIPDGIEDAVRYTNPNYSEEDYRYNRNCQRCVAAYEMRRRGFDVIAKPLLSEPDAIMDNYTLPWKGASMIGCPKGNGKETIEQKMQEYGDGTRAIVRVQWAGEDFGHVFIAEQVSGRTLFIDPQTNEIDVAYYFDFAEISATTFARVDNLDVSAYIKDCCKENDNDKL